jgi:hypothetical protein
MLTIVYNVGTYNVHTDNALSKPRVPGTLLSAFFFLLNGIYVMANLLNLSILTWIIIHRD